MATETKLRGTQRSLQYPVSPDLEALTTSFVRHLRASNRAPKTVETYVEALRGFETFLSAKGMPLTALGIRREHVEHFMADLLERWKPATASNRYRALAVFFKWL